MRVLNELFLDISVRLKNPITALMMKKKKKNHQKLMVWNMKTRGN